MMAIISLLIWTLNHPVPANILLITRDFYFEDIVLELIEMGYRVMLAYDHAPLDRYTQKLINGFEVVWRLTDLLKGQPPLDEEQLLRICNSTIITPRKNKSKKKTTSASASGKSRLPNPLQSKDEEGLEENDDDEHGEGTYGACADNDGTDEFWIYCDICEKCFHGTCVKKIPPAQAEHIKQYKCPSVVMTELASKFHSQQTLLEF